MITYVLYCYPQQGPHVSIIQKHEVGLNKATKFVQNKLVHKALDNGLFVSRVVVETEKQCDT